MADRNQAPDLPHPRQQRHCNLLEQDWNIFEQDWNHLWLHPTHGRGHTVVRRYDMPYGGIVETRTTTFGDEFTLRIGEHRAQDEVGGRRDHGRPRRRSRSRERGDHQGRRENELQQNRRHDIPLVSMDRGILRVNPNVPQGDDVEIHVTPPGNVAPPRRRPVSTLKTRRLKEADKAEDGNLECEICMVGKQVGDKVTELSCAHWFDRECIQAWLDGHRTCPKCRSHVA